MEPTTPASAEIKPAPRRRGRRLLAGLGLGSLLLAGGLAWLGGTTAGLETLAGLARSLSDGRLQCEGPQGRLLGAWQCSVLRWESPDLQLRIEQLAVDWSPGRLLHGDLQVASLSAAEVAIDQSDSATTTPPPADLGLPLTARVENIAIGRLRYAGQPVADGLEARLEFDGKSYTLDAARAALGDLALSAEARLDAAQPMQLEATASVRGQLAERPLRLALRASGPLERFALAVTTHEGLSGDAQIVVTPFADAPFAAARIALDDIDPAVWQAEAPGARLRLEADFKPAGTGVAGRFALSNSKPGKLDAQALPLVSLTGQLDWQDGNARLAELRARLPGGGELSGEGSWKNDELQLNLAARRLDLAQLAGGLRTTQLAGPLRLQLGKARQRLTAELGDGKLTLRGEAEHAGERLSLPRLEILAGKARLVARGELALAGARSFTAEGELAQFDPSFFGKFPSATINADFAVSGRLEPQLRGEGRFTLKDSRWAGAPLAGHGRLNLEWPRVPLADIELQGGINRLAVQGAFGRPGDMLRFDIAAPQLAPYGIDGDLAGRFEIGGDTRQLQFSGKLQSSRFGLAGWQAQEMQLTANAGATPGAPFWLDFAAARVDAPQHPALWRHLQIHGEGTRAAHRLNAQGDLAGKNHLTVDLAGALGEDKNGTRWHGELRQLEMAATDKARNFRLLAPAPLELAENAWKLGPARFGGQTLDWRATLQADAAARHLRASLQASGSRLGEVNANIDAGLAGAWSLAPEATWHGELDAAIPDLGWAAELLGEGWKSNGTLNGRLELAGTPGRPVVSGQLRGSELGLRLAEQGLALEHGELQVDLANNRLQVRKLAFDSLLRPMPRPLQLALREEDRTLADRPGRLEITGELPISAGQSGESGRLNIRLERLGAVQQADRWLLLSGENQLDWRDGNIAVSGQLNVDAAWWQLAPGGAPRLSDDVVIRRPDTAPEASWQPRGTLDVGIDLGRYFLFSGGGVSARLSGDLRLRAGGRDLPRATGSIRLRDGRFDAYGQQLDIERGILTFQGLPDNPGLDVRAMRRGLAVEAGVQISGTARKPVVRLVSDPEVADAEKLSWLVLGHGPEQMGASDTGVLLSAASGLLGNDSGGLVTQIRKRFGVDELGVRSGRLGETGGRTQGSRVAGSTQIGVDDSQQIFVVGKRLSSQVMLSYEQALGKAENIVKLTLSLSRRLSLVGRVGSDNAIDLFYTYSFGRPERKPSP